MLTGKALLQCEVERFVSSSRHLIVHLRFIPANGFYFLTLSSCETFTTPCVFQRNYYVVVATMYRPYKFILSKYFPRARSISSPRVGSDANKERGTGRTMTCLH